MEGIAFSWPTKKEQIFEMLKFCLKLILFHAKIHGEGYSVHYSKHDHLVPSTMEEKIFELCHEHSHHWYRCGVIGYAPKFSLLHFTNKLMGQYMFIIVIQ